jgi:hypothetical protein
MRGILKEKGSLTSAAVCSKLDASHHDVLGEVVNVKLNEIFEDTTLTNCCACNFYT